MDLEIVDAGQGAASLDLLRAVHRARGQEAEDAIRRGGDPNGRYSNGEPVLGAAADRIGGEGMAEVFRELLRAGADPSAAGAGGQTAMHRLARSAPADAKEAMRAAEELVRAGADVSARDSGGWGPLEVALRWGKTELAAALIGWGAEPVEGDALGRRITEVLESAGAKGEARTLARAAEERQEMGREVPMAEGDSAGKRAKRRI